MGYNGRIVKGHIRIAPRDQARAHAAILALDGADSIDTHPVYNADPDAPLVRRTVRLNQAVLDSEDVWEAIAHWGAWWSEELGKYWAEPMAITVTNPATGQAFIDRDDWRRVLGDNDLWHALAPFIQKMTVKYEGEDRHKWAFQKEPDGRVWEWTTPRWHKVRPLELRPLVRPQPITGRIHVTEVTPEGVSQHGLDLDTGERFEWSDVAAATAAANLKVRVL